MLEFYVLWAAFVLVSLGYSFRFVWQMNRAARLMKKGDLNEMVVELDRLLSKTRNRQFAQLIRLNKSAALVYLGRWDSALEILYPRT